MDPSSPALQGGFLNTGPPVKVKVAQLGQSCPTLCDPMDYRVPGILQSWILEWVGSLSLLQGIFPTQGSNPSFSHCRQILYQLSHKGSPRILEWAAYLFSRASSQPMNQTGVSCIAGGFFTNWATVPPGITSIKCSFEKYSMWTRWIKEKRDPDEVRMSLKTIQGPRGTTF